MADYLGQENEDDVMDEESFDWRLQEERAKEIMEHISGCTSSSDFQQLDPSVRKQYAQDMYLKGLSMGQIARLTGMSKTTISRAVNGKKDLLSAQDELILRESEPVDYDCDPEIIW